MHNCHCLSYTTTIIYHAQWNQHAYTQAIIQHVYFISLTVNMVAEVKMDKITYLMKNPSVAAMSLQRSTQP